VSYNLAQHRVYQHLRQAGTQTQPTIAQSTGLSLPSVIHAVKRLEQQKLILEAGEERGQGRPAKRYRTTPEQHLIQAIDLGGSSIRSALFDLEGKKLETTQTISLYEFSKLNRTQAIAHLQELTDPRAARIGICAPGIIRPNATLENSWLFGFETVARQTLEDTFGKPVLLENDARSAAWGELRCGHGTSNFAFIIFAYGIGAGIVLNGQLLRGQRGAAGEMSYMPNGFTGFEKPRLGALAYGFFEELQTVSSDLNIKNRESEVFQAAQNGSSLAQKAVQKAVQHIALAIAGIITTLDPERIVLRQEFSHTQELVLEPLRTMLQSIGLTTPLELSALGQDAGLIGIGLLTAEQLEQELLAQV
jgi:predicted NBD/HSP70 family sugar kinase